MALSAFGAVMVGQAAGLWMKTRAPYRRMILVYPRPDTLSTVFSFQKPILRGGAPPACNRHAVVARYGRTAPLRTTAASRRQAVCFTGPGSLWLGRPVSTWPAKRRTTLSSPPRSVVAVIVRSYQPWLDDSSK